jgi:hypothetical protein
MQELQSISANFPLNVKLMAHCTRNKIAHVALTALRELPIAGNTLRSPYGTDPRVEES